MMFYVLAIVLMVGGSSFATWHVTSGYYQMKEDRAIAEGVAVEAARRADIATKLAALEREKAKIQEIEVIKWKTIKKEVERVVQSDPVYVRLECRVTDDGVRVYNAAAQGLQLAVATGKDATVSQEPPPAKTGGVVGRPSGDSGSSVRPVPRM
jgi:hypothetical protein